jgi:hypothetical protein
MMGGVLGIVLTMLYFDQEVELSYSEFQTKLESGKVQKISLKSLFNYSCPVDSTSSGSR